MRLVTLGTAAAGVPRSGDSGTGNLLEHGDTRLLVDVGGGVLGALAAHAPLDKLSGVFLSHLHNDHVADLYPLALWARFTRRRLPIYGPVGTRTLLYRWFSLFSSDPDPYVQALEIVEMEEWRVYTLGETRSRSEGDDVPHHVGIRFMACPVEHNVACFALRAEAGGKRFVFSGDTRAGALLEEAALDADLFLCEATYQDLPPGRDPEKSRDHHMTAREAGLLAKKARAKRLVLTHLKYDLDRETSRKQAEEGYGAPVEVAEPGRAFEL